MSALLECEVEFFPNPHLMQLYTGFFDLEQRGVIKLRLIKKKKDPLRQPIISVIINNKIKVLYDTSDGFIWIQGSREENLHFFHKNFEADYYFKRSYHHDLLQFAPSGCQVFPLGLNYNVHPDANLFFLSDSINDKLKYIIKTNDFLKKIFQKKFFYKSDFEFPPLLPKEERVLFLTRVWDPKLVPSERSKASRQEVNEMRIECIEACRKKFGKYFLGGVQSDEFSLSHYQSYTLPPEITTKRNFTSAVKESTVCIATTGLHDSIGWKFAEYVAASRAIVSEPLKYELPGSLKAERNYLEFSSPDQLVYQIDRLLSNRDLKLRIMENNYCYYNSYVRPENLIINSLITILNNQAAEKDQINMLPLKDFPKKNILSSNFKIF